MRASLTRGGNLPAGCFAGVGGLENVEALGKAISGFDSILEVVEGVDVDVIAVDDGVGVFCGVKAGEKVLPCLLTISDMIAVDDGDDCFCGTKAVAKVLPWLRKHPSAVMVNTTLSLTVMSHVLTTLRELN